MPARALIVSWEYPPIVEGGLARHVRKLAEGLAADGHEVHVLTRGGRRAPASERRHGVEVHRVVEPDFPRELGAFVAWVARLNADLLAAGEPLIADGAFDVVHSHDWLVARAANRLARRAGAPWVTTIHATEYGRHQGWVGEHPQSHIHAVERWMAHRADRVLCCSQFMRSHITEALALDRAAITVIPNGIDPADLHCVEDLPALRARYAAPHERLVLLAGRLVYEKGFQLALEAVPGLAAELPDVQVVVAGAGTHEHELRAQAQRLGIGDRAHFLGWTGDLLLHSLYRVADVCVVPSIYEPFGLVALEAMASGCPCIVADTGGLREVVPSGSGVGLRFRSRDPGALASRLRRVLTDDSLRAQMADRGREHVRGFDWAHVAARTAGVYAALREPAVA